MAGPRLAAICRAKARLLIAVVAVIIVAVRLALEMSRPVVVDLEGTVEVHVEAVGPLIQRILRRILIVIILRADEAVDGELARCAVLEVVDILRILVDLLLQRVNLTRVLGSELVENSLITEGAAALDRKSVV